MQLYFQEFIEQDKIITLDTNTSRHLIQVLRMKEGEQILLTDGKGQEAIGVIIVADKRHTQAQCKELKVHAPKSTELTVAVSFTKNKSRNEWMMEKLVEIGVHTIQPIITQRTEKEKFNMERCIAILQSAMLQSKQYYLPKMEAPISLKTYKMADFEQKYVAHCEDQAEKQLITDLLQANKKTLILIGPEGDFTPEEIDYLLKQGLQPVSLGSNRLRTETAAIYAATIFNTKNEA